MKSISLASREAVLATVTFFAYNGLVVGVWAGSLPSLREKLGLTGDLVATLLVITGIGAIAGMQISGRVVDRIGARKVALAYIPVLMLAIVAVSIAPTYPALVVCAFFLGMGNGGIDVSMNALGVNVEKSRPRPIMSFFHGMWSVGNFGGALLVLLVATFVFAGETARIPQAAAAAAVMLGIPALWYAWQYTPTTAPVSHVDEHGAKTKIPASAYLLGLMAIAFGLGEGTAMDWSGILVRDVTHVDAGQASVAVATVAAFMVVIRLTGDRLVSRFGRRTMVRVGGVCASLGYVLAATASVMPVLLIGWALVGFGIGIIAPQVYAIAGHTGGGRGLAVVVTFGYATFLAGPAVVGYLVDHLGIQPTMFVPAVLLFGLIFLAGVMPTQDLSAGGASD